ncbi:MAG TPA: hypothetical protein VGP64_12640 [Polyangia bacterium]
MINGYSAGGVSCAMCTDNNGNDKSAVCIMVIKCYDTNYPCGSANNCANGCNNMGADSVIQTKCITPLLTAGNCVQP